MSGVRRRSTYTIDYPPKALHAEGGLISQTPGSQAGNGAQQINCRAPQDGAMGNDTLPAGIQPMKFEARTSYTVEYPPKDLYEQDDLRTSFMLRPDMMNQGFVQPACPLDGTTTYGRDYFEKRASYDLDQAPAETSKEPLPRVRFNSVSAYQADYIDKAVKPDYSKAPTQLEFNGPEGIPPPMPLEARTSYTAEFGAKPIIRDADIRGDDLKGAILPDVRFSAGTTYRASFEGKPLDMNLMQADDPKVQSTPEFRKFSTERRDQYDIGLPNMNIERRTSYVSDFCDGQIIPVRRPVIGHQSGKFTAGTTYRASFVGTRVDKNVLGADKPDVEPLPDFRNFRTEHDSY